MNVRSAALASSFFVLASLSATSAFAQAAAPAAPTQATTSPGTQVIAATPTGQVSAVGCTSVVVDPNAKTTIGATPAAVPCPPPAPVSATPPAAVPMAPELKTKTKWYGWQTLITDGAALMMTTASAGGSTTDARQNLALLALGTYALGGPVVHLANGSAGKAGGSFLLRVGAPLALGYLGYQAGKDDGDWGGLIWASFGVLGGIATAVAVDSAVLAKKTVEDTSAAPSQPAEDPQARAPKLRVSPSFAATKGGATLGAVGTF